MSGWIFLGIFLWLCGCLPVLSMLGGELSVDNRNEQVKIDAAILLLALLWPFTLVILINRDRAEKKAKQK